MVTFVIFWCPVSESPSYLLKISHYMSLSRGQGPSPTRGTPKMRSLLPQCPLQLTCEMWPRLGQSDALVQDLEMGAVLCRSRASAGFWRWQEQQWASGGQWWCQGQRSVPSTGGAEVWAVACPLFSGCCSPFLSDWLLSPGFGSGHGCWPSYLSSCPCAGLALQACWWFHELPECLKKPELVSVAYN